MVSVSHALVALLTLFPTGSVGTLLARHGLTAETAADRLALELVSPDEAADLSVPWSDALVATVHVARRIAIMTEQTAVRNDHWLLGVLRSDSRTSAFLRKYLSADEVEAELGLQPPVSRRCHKLLLVGRELAHKLGHTVCGTEHMLLVMISEELAHATAWMSAQGIDLGLLASLIDQECMGRRGVPMLRTLSELRPAGEDVTASPRTPDAKATERLPRHGSSGASGRPLAPLSHRLNQCLERAYFLTGAFTSESFLAAALIDGTSVAFRAIDACLRQQRTKTRRRPSFTGTTLPDGPLALLHSLLRACAVPEHLRSAAMDEASHSSGRQWPPAARSAPPSSAPPTTTSESKTSLGATDVESKGTESPSAASAASAPAAAAGGSVGSGGRPAMITLSVPWRAFWARAGTADSAVLSRATWDASATSPPAVTVKAHTGPTNASNWLVPGHVLLSSFPDRNPAELHALLDVGVRVFVPLVGEWSTNELRFNEYPRDLGSILSRSKIPNDNALIIHFPVPDFSTPNLLDLGALVGELATRVRRGEIVMLHCLGGHGRSGLVACSLLQALFPSLSAQDAIAYTHNAHAQRPRCKSRRCMSTLPETNEQSAMVRDVRFLSKREAAFYVSKIAKSAGRHK